MYLMNGRVRRSTHGCISAPDLDGQQPDRGQGPQSQGLGDQGQFTVDVARVPRQGKHHTWFSDYLALLNGGPLRCLPAGNLFGFAQREPTSLSAGRQLIWHPASRFSFVVT